MPRLRSRLDALERSASAPRAVRFLHQVQQPDGHRKPSDADLAREMARLEAEGFDVRRWRVVIVNEPSPLVAYA